MTTDDFINMLEQRRLVPVNTARQLRAKAAQGDDRITPKAILKYLVKKEIVSRTQAKELLETTLTVSDKAESSILGLAPLAEFQELQRSSLSEKVPPKATQPSTPADGEMEKGKEKSSSAERKNKSVNSTTAGSRHDDDLAISFGSGETADPLGVAANEADSSFEESSSASEKKGKRSKKKRKRSAGDRGKSEWDSPLLLLGGGGLAVLIIAGGVIYYLLTRENADEVFKQANDYFDGGSYQQAIGQYEKFVKDYPSHQDFSQAKVRLGMSKLWRDAEGTSNFAGALETAKQVINEIENEPAFASDGSDEDGLSQAKRELSSLLTSIAKGLAEQADGATDDAVAKERIAQIKETLALTANTKYVPQRFRQDNELNAVRETLERVEARQQRDADLAAALAEMDGAIAKGDAAAAFAVRMTLVKQYPFLIDDAALAEKVLQIAAAEQATVKFVVESQAAITAEAKSPIVAELALAERRGAAAQGAAGLAVVRTDGALYGLSAADGALQWRRFVGFDAGSYPLLTASGEVVAADAQRQELICLDAASGQLRWRLPLEGKLATPVAVGRRLLAASDAGRLYVVEQASGKLIGYVQFSQPLRLPPGANERGDRIYVLGEHSNLYTLSADDFKCLGVHYLGHAAGGMAAPPIAVLNKVIVADNSGDETSLIRVLTLNEQGAAAGEAASQRLSGLVLTPLPSAGRRFAAVTTQGQAMVFEVAAANDASALTPLASRDARDGEQLTRFGLMHDGHLWLAANELTKLAVLPTENRLPVRSIDRDYRGDAFDYPLQTVGELIVHVRRPKGQGGAVVAAMDAANNKALWETAVAVPPAGPPAIDAGRQLIVAGASSGAVYVLDRQAMAKRVQDHAERLSEPSLKAPLYDDALDLSQGRLALGGHDASQLLYFRPNEPQQPLRAIALPGALRGALAAWENGFAAATDVGQTFLYGDDGAALATPFQPELIPGQRYEWLPPVAVGEGDEAQLVISDGVAKVYLLRMAGEPQPHLEATATVDVGPSPLTTRLAAAGAMLYVGNEAGQLARFKLPDLAPDEAIDLGGRVAWGPYAAGAGVLLSTDADELLLIDDNGAVKWRQPLEHGDLDGAPLVDGDSVFILHPAAGVANRSLSDGAEAGFVELGQPAVAGPVAFGPRLVLTAPDGTLLVINRP